MNQPESGNFGSLATELRQQSTTLAARTPFDLLVEKARAGELDDDQIFRLLGRLWVIKRMMYYVYGGWAQGLNVNEYPPSVVLLTDNAPPGGYRTSSFTAGINQATSGLFG